MSYIRVYPRKHPCALLWNCIDCNGVQVVVGQCVGKLLWFTACVVAVVTAPYVVPDRWTINKGLIQAKVTIRLTWQMRLICRNLEDTDKPCCFVRCSAFDLNILVCVYQVDMRRTVTVACCTQSNRLDFMDFR
jgi:hypothetical protein